MTQTPKVTPKDFFLWLGTIIALYVSVGSLIALLFEYIERVFGIGAIIGYDPYSGGIRFAIASLLVLFPVYLLLTRLLNKDIRANPLKKELWVRKWAIFATVFFSAIGLIIDLVVLIHTFLGGEELTAAFLMKVFTIFVLFGGVFYYYLHDIRGTWERNEKKSKAIGAGVAALVIVAIIAGFFIMGSPATQRKLRQDDQRINDLRSIQAQVTDFYRDTERLPEDLDEMRDELLGYYINTDPETGESYEYAPTGDLTFEVCATFALPLPEIEDDRVIGDSYDWRVRELKQTAEEWAHDSGRTCFEREIDPERITLTKPTLVR